MLLAGHLAYGAAGEAAFLTYASVSLPFLSQNRNPSRPFGHAEDVDLDRVCSTKAAGPQLLRKHCFSILFFAAFVAQRFQACKSDASSESQRGSSTVGTS